MQATITAFQTIANPAGQVQSGNYKWSLVKNGSIVSSQTVGNSEPFTFEVSEPGNYSAQVSRLSDSGVALGSVAQSNTVNIPFPGLDVPKTVTLSL
jgi:hypothetical protein